MRETTLVHECGGGEGGGKAGVQTKHQLGGSGIGHS